MNARNGLVILTVELASAAALAAVYRSGLKQVHGSVRDYLLGTGDASWNAMCALDPRVFTADYAIPEDTDYTMGALVFDLGDDQDSGTDEPHTAENPVSGRIWGWTGDYHFYGYLGQMWLDAGVTYQMYCKSDNWAKLYVDGSLVASYGVGAVTPLSTGWHDIEIYAWDHDWRHGFYGGEALSGACWNTNGVTDANNEGFEHWRRFLTDSDSCRLRTAYTNDFVTASVTPTETGYRFLVASSSSSPATVRVSLSSTAADPEDASAWAVHSADETVPADGSVYIDMPWADEAIPYYTIYAEGEDAQFAEGYGDYVQFGEVTACVSAGVCTWTGAGGDNIWNNRANWDLGRIPMVDDTAMFSDVGIEEGDNVVVTSSVQVLSILIDAGGSFSISSTNDAVLGSGGIVFGEDSSSLVTVSADYRFMPGVDGTNQLVVAAGARIRFTGDTDAESSAVVIRKSGAGEASFDHERAAISATRPTFVVGEGTISANQAYSVCGVFHIGGGEADAAIYNNKDNALAHDGSGQMAAYVYTNGVFNLTGNFRWDRMPTMYIYHGGQCLYGGGYKCGKVHFYGGGLGAIDGYEALAHLRPDGNYEETVYATDYMSWISIPWRLAGNEYPFKFDVRRGTAAADLLIGAPITGTGADTQTHYKKGDGIAVCTATNSLRATTNRGNGFEIRGGTWIADGEAAFGDCKAWVLAGAVLGGVGVIGDTAATADLCVTGTASVLESSAAVYATVRPGTIELDESSPRYGKHVYGTLTVGGDTVANNVEMSTASRLEIGFGGERAADKLAVRGAVSLSAVDSVLRLVNEAEGGVKVRGVEYVVLEAAGGLTGRFAEIDCVGFRHAPTVAYTATQVVVTVPGSGLLLVIR